MPLDPLHEARETKWKANQAKVAFLQRIPWIVTSWEQAVGLTIEQAIPFPESPHSVVLIFSDGSMTIASHPVSEPQTLTKGFLAARPHLEARHPDTFAAYDQLNHLDKEAGRQARMQNILGAIRNNVQQIPELKDQLRALVREWETEK